MFGGEGEIKESKAYRFLPTVENIVAYSARALAFMLLIFSLFVLAVSATGSARTQSSRLPSLKFESFHYTQKNECTH